MVDDAIGGSDAIGTARVLAAAITHLGAQEPVDLVITGMAGLDALTSLLPTAIAELLDLPALPLAAELTVDADARTVRVRRNLDHSSEVLEASLPALVSVTDQANEPRYPGFKGIMAARKIPITTLTLADLGAGRRARRRTRGPHRGARGRRPTGAREPRADQRHRRRRRPARRVPRRQPARLKEQDLSP